MIFVLWTLLLLREDRKKRSEQFHCESPPSSAYYTGTATWFQENQDTTGVPLTRGLSKVVEEEDLGDALTDEQVCTSSLRKDFGEVLAQGWGGTTRESEVQLAPLPTQYSSAFPAIPPTSLRRYSYQGPKSPPNQNTTK